MPFSAHSHSGQFCRHAKNTLAEMVEQAMAVGFPCYSLTEHMPRFRPCDLYPEESDISPADLEEIFGRYVAEARRLQALYQDRIQLLVGMETELCRPESADDIAAVRAKHGIDFVVGSAHHVNGMPIDFSQELFDKAEVALGGPEQLCVAYFEALAKLISTIRPEVIGHFDLIHLFRRGYDPTPAVLAAADKAIAAAVKCNSLFEVNSAGLRKGLPCPYPATVYLKRILACGGKLTISDDAHSVQQVATHYKQLREFLLTEGVVDIYKLEMTEDGGVRPVVIPDWAGHPVWSSTALPQ
eukprot:m.257296 g.257296  ORF g.257296 m.257296 type:complete len:298 (+) comp19180_c4_seq2:140-1033(+)